MSGLKMKLSELRQVHVALLGLDGSRSAKDSNKINQEVKEAAVTVPVLSRQFTSPGSSREKDCELTRNCGTACDVLRREDRSHRTAWF